MSAAGDHVGANAVLTSLLVRIDGDPSPPDWLAPSAERDALYEEVTLLIELLEFLR